MGENSESHYLVGKLSRLKPTMIFMEFKKSAKEDRNKKVRRNQEKVDAYNRGCHGTKLSV